MLAPPPPSLVAWASTRLDALGVDGVFAPYIVNMLADADDAPDDPDDVKFNVHQVLMGWLSPEDEVRAVRTFACSPYRSRSLIGVLLIHSLGPRARVR